MTPRMSRAKKQVQQNRAPIRAETSGVGERLLALMEEKKLSQRGLAQLVGIRQQSVHYLIHGRSGEPKSRYMAQIAGALGVDPHWLETGKGDRLGTGVLAAQGGTVGRRIPIRTAAGITSGTEEAPRDTVADTREPEAFAYDVTDNAMSPDVLRGDRLIVAPKRQPKPGELVLASVDGSVELRRFRVLGTGAKPKFELAAKHPDYPAFTSETNKCLLIGVVIEQRRFMPLS